MKLIKLSFRIAFALTSLAVIGCADPSGSDGSNRPSGPDEPSVPGDYVSDLVGTLKYVPAGRFRYDGTPGNDRTVGAFRIGQHEITRTQYLQIMGVDRTYEAFSTG